MAYVQVQDLLIKTGSIYKLVVLASRRAVELNAGAPKLVESQNQKVSTIALEEISQGKVRLGKAKGG
jgi:DNA-directed RNA polymerase omega subunit